MVVAVGLLLSLMDAELCGGCGTEVVDGSHFCHVCGRRVDVEPIEFDIYGDQQGAVRGSKPSPSEPARNRGVAALAALALAFLGGLAVFSWVRSDDSPTPAVAPTTSLPPSTVPPVSSTAGSTEAQVDASVHEVADPLVWHVGPDIGALTPIGIVEYKDQVLVFATELSQRLSFGAPGLGLTAWRSDDGVAWESLGTVIEPPNQLTSVAASPDGMMAVGRSSAGAAAIWRSDDGSNWQMELLPEPGFISTNEPIPRMSASVGGVDVIVGYPDFENSERLVNGAIEKVTGASVGEFGFSVGQDGASTEIVVRGPFGLPLMSLPADELGLSEDEMRSAFNGGSRSLVTTVWSSADGGDWQASTLDDVAPSSLSVTPDGKFIMTSFGPAGQRTWVSSRGVEWQNPTTRLNRPSSIVPWRRSLIGAGFEITSDLAVSNDGVIWQSIGAADLFPDNYYLNSVPISAGDDGVAATAVQFLIEQDLEQPASEAILVKDGFTLTANNAGELVLRRGDELLWTFSVRPTDPPGVLADLVERTVTFVDPTTSEPYVSFTIDELGQLESAAGQDFGPVSRQNLILFSNDLGNWSINDVADLAIGNTSVSALQVTSVGLVAGITRVPKGPLTSTNRPVTMIYIADYPF